MSAVLSAVDEEEPASEASSLSRDEMESDDGVRAGRRREGAGAEDAAGAASCEAAADVTPGAAEEVAAAACCDGDEDASASGEADTP